ncbi:MAG: DUF1919 domain-containing protein [Lachnospiraceae bacterium]|nr:DUF1919 domain-containing protein [Lachnospiraceae bacterium]
MIRYLWESCQIIKKKIKTVEWKIYKKKRCCRLKNSDFTIIASNCNGSFMYYDMGLSYLTPTVNLFLNMNDFDYAKFLNRGR